VLDGPSAQFVSKQGHRLTAFGELGRFLRRLLLERQVILDGELALPDATGRTVFSDLMARRNAAQYFAFDVLMFNGKDLRERPLVERKKILKSLLPQPSSRVHYVDHLAEHGTALFRLACQHDLEGIVAKRADSPYAMAGRKSPWRKIKNPNYSQREGPVSRGRSEVFRSRISKGFANGCIHPAASWSARFRGLWRSRKCQEST
jgi:bifunctional non-homologous end joining protein LigD